ncbi:hypothetical protein SAY87_014497 [Trapa incisa]|uniref:WRKY domain-containing protein n=1 Tax=Trapa incisa TaxID=236973 RepID=A0AAN7GK32_9MYRT|nr:hypothetical protein SAY87_014497 [Trapa incisa]
MMEADSWDLAAVVRGCCNCNGGLPTTEASPFLDSSTNDPAHNSDDTSFTYSLETSVISDDLESIYKPFYPGFQGGHRMASSSQFDIKTCIVHAAASPVASALESATLAMTKYRRRKNEQCIRVVEHKAAQDLLSIDEWAWRKYGQKPIKGSLHQRSYYRCSTSRGCPARKKIERSAADSRVLIVSYSADHNHPQPARRNSLSGSTRRRFAPPNKENYNGPQSNYGNMPNTARHSTQSPISAVISSSPMANLIELTRNQGYPSQVELELGKTPLGEKGPW